MVNIELNIWDPPANDDDNWDSFYRGSDGVILVFDLSYPLTFYSELFAEIIQRIQALTSAPLILVGNKVDLVSLDESEINKESVYELKSQYNMSEFIITSAKTGENIDVAFKKLVDAIVRKKEELGQLSEELEFKITLAGLPQVGKTSILERYTQNTFKEEVNQLTVGGSFSSKIIQYKRDQAPKSKKKRSKKDKSKASVVADEILGDRKMFRDAESEKYEDVPEESARFDGPPGGGIPSPVPPRASESFMEEKIERKVKVERKATVFYKERMNPMKLNKMAVIISTEELYESLKTVSKKVSRAATGLTLEIDEEVPMLEVKPIIPGCICSPPIANLDARKEYDHALFLITPLEAGDIPEARVEIYYRDELIDAIPTPINVVKTTIVKISTALTLAIPIIGSLFDRALEGVLEAALPFYELIGGLDGMLAILTGLFSVLTAMFYYFRKPKDATPAESKSLEELVSTVAEE